MTEIAKAAETAKKTAELAKKIDSTKREVKNYQEITESRLKKGLDASSSSIDLKYAARRLESQKNELDRLKNK